MKNVREWRSNHSGQDSVYCRSLLVTSSRQFLSFIHPNPVIPAKAGIQLLLQNIKPSKLDPCLRRGDGIRDENENYFLFILESKTGQLSPPCSYCNYLLLAWAKRQSLRRNLLITTKIFGDFFPACINILQRFIDSDFASHIAGKFSIQNN